MFFVFVLIYDFPASGWIFLNFLGNFWTLSPKIDEDLFLVVVQLFQVCATLHNFAFVALHHFSELFFNFPFLWKRRQPGPSFIKPIVMHAKNTIGVWPSSFWNNDLHCHDVEYGDHHYLGRKVVFVVTMMNMMMIIIWAESRCSDSTLAWEVTSL